MKRFKTNLKYIMFGGIALAMAACADENVTGGNDSNPDISESSLNKASYTMGGGDQSRAINLGKWTKTGTRAISEDWKIEVPQADANNYIVNTQQDVWNLPNNLSNVNIYVTGNIDNFSVPNAGSGIDVYIVEGVTVKWDNQSSGTIANVYNEGKLELGPYSLQTANNIKDIHSRGELYFGQAGQNWLNIASGHLIYSDGPVYFYGGVTLEAETYINNKLIVDGTLKIQTGSNTKDICEIESTGKVEVVTDLTVGSIVAPEITFDGALIQLHPNGVVRSPLLNMGKDGCKILAAENSEGLVDTKYIDASNAKSINDVFGVGVYVNFETIKYYDEINAKSVIEISAEDYQERAGDIATQGGINSGKDIKFECGGEAEPSDPDPKPSLDLITDVKSPDHNHDADKPGEVGSKPRRHLSATSLTFDGNGNIYASYHMRGGNWGGDTYDKDDIEGCIESWSFDGNEIKIGNWMWTNEFDFNHIILDGSDIITVGHKGSEHTDYGGIIGKLPVSNFSKVYVDADDQYEEEDFQYKYLTTNVAVYGPSKVEGKEDILIDYENAGDGNCVVRVGDEYFVATSAGYGIINAKDEKDENGQSTLFKRIKDEAGNVLFQSTPGSAKYLVVDNGQVNVLYLNQRPGKGESTTANTSYGATLATMDTPAFPSEGTTMAMPAYVSPVDGKNVIAVDGMDVYACLSNGGLAKNGELFEPFGENRPVNGVAVDEKYIYVANGSYLTVLNKATKEKVVERKGNTNNVSANFVEVKQIDGVRYIFVAFGQEGIKVFRLNIPGE